MKEDHPTTQLGKILRKMFDGEVPAPLPRRLVELLQAHFAYSRP